MAAFKTSVLLLGVVVLATMLEAPEAHYHCSHNCDAVDVVYIVNTEGCKYPMQVQCTGMDEYKHCPGGEVTVFPPVTLDTTLNGVLEVVVGLLNAAEIVVKNITMTVPTDLGTLLGDVLHIVLNVTSAPNTNQLDFTCGGQTLTNLPITGALQGLLDSVTGTVGNLLGGLLGSNRP